MKPEEFKNIRSQLQLSQQQYAVMLGSALRSVQYWESGERKIPKVVQILAKVMLQINSMGKR